MSKKKVKTLSECEMKFIDINWEEMTHEQIAVKLGIAVSAVSNYCYQNGYRKVKTKRGTRPKKPKVYQNMGPEKKYIDRPPAVYSNPSRDQHVDRWLSVAV